MGVSHSPEAFAAKLAGLAANLTALDQATVGQAALTTKETISAGAPSRLRGVGRRGARLSVRYTVTHSAADPAALVFAQGPWQLIESDTRPHEIPRARGPRARGKVRHAVVPGGSEAPPHGKGGVRAHVHVSGTRGKHPWRKGVQRAEPLVARLFHARVVALLGRTF